MEKFANNLLNIYIKFFSKKRFQLLYDVIIHFCLKAKGYKNYGSSKVTGEFFFLNLIKKYKIKLAIDVGANVGQTSIQLLEILKCNVIAFEPMIHSYNELNKIKLLYGEKLQTYNLALSDKNKREYIYYPNLKSQLATFEKNYSKINFLKNKIVGRKKIKTVTLDRFINDNKKIFKNGFDFLKIDTEGNDYNVLIGSLKSINKFSPKFIQFEMNSHYIFKSINLYKMSSFFTDYKLYKILPYNSGLIKVKNSDPTNNIFHLSNFVLVRKDISL